MLRFLGAKYFAIFQSHYTNKNAAPAQNLWYYWRKCWKNHIEINIEEALTWSGVGPDHCDNLEKFKVGFAFLKNYAIFLMAKDLYMRIEIQY